MQIPECRNTLTVGSVFQWFRDGTPRTRAEIAKASGLGRAALNSRLETLLEAGLIVPAGSAASSGGRPPRAARFDIDSGVILALDFGASQLTIGVTDLAGTPIASDSVQLRIDNGPDACLSTALGRAEALLKDFDRTVVGVGIGVPGPVEHSSGRPIKPPIMPGWDDFDIPAAVRLTFDCDVLVDNDVNLLAIGEHTLRGFDTENMVYVKVATGIGAGIIASGQIQRGARGSAGDLGHIYIKTPKSPLTVPDDTRDLEAIASGTAVAAALRELGVNATNSADVVSLVDNGDPTAINLTRESGRIIGEALATIVNLLNPSLIVIGGTLGRASDHLIAGAREVIYRRSIPLATQLLSIEPSQGGALLGVRGAATMVLQHVLSAKSIDERVRAQASAAQPSAPAQTE